MTEIVATGLLAFAIGVTVGFALAVILLEEYHD
jgi:hypothetical protein